MKILFLLYGGACLFSVLLAFAAILYRRRGEQKRVYGSISAFFRDFGFFGWGTIAVCILAAVIGCRVFLCAGWSLILFVQYLVLWDTLFLIAMIDYRTKKIPNRLILFLFLVRAVGCTAEVLVSPDRWIPILGTSLVGLAVGALLILAFMLLSRGGIGAGDLKLFSVLGFFFGFSGLFCILLYSLIVMSLVCIGLLLSKKAGKQSTVPMAPFVLFGLSFYLLFL